MQRLLLENSQSRDLKDWELRPLVGSLLCSRCSLSFSAQTQRPHTSRAQRFDVPAGNCWLISLCSSLACCSYTTHQRLMNPVCPSAASEESRESWRTTHGECSSSNGDQMFTEWVFCAESEHLFISVLQKDVSEMQIMLVQIKRTLCGLTALRQFIENLYWNHITFQTICTHHPN